MQEKEQEEREERPVPIRLVPSAYGGESSISSSITVDHPRYSFRGCCVRTRFANRVSRSPWFPRPIFATQRYRSPSFGALLNNASGIPCIRRYPCRQCVPRSRPSHRRHDGRTCGIAPVSVMAAAQNREWKIVTRLWAILLRPLIPREARKLNRYSSPEQEDYSCYSIFPCRTFMQRVLARRNKSRPSCSLRQPCRPTRTAIPGLSERVGERERKRERGKEKEKERWRKGKKRTDRTERGNCSR